MTDYTSIISEIPVKQLHYCLYNVRRNRTLRENDYTQIYSLLRHWKDVVPLKTFIAFIIDDTINGICRNYLLEKEKSYNKQSSSRIAQLPSQNNVIRTGAYENEFSVALILQL